MTQIFPELFILRHGETVWNNQHRLQGRLDSPLTEKGQLQARQQGQILSAAGVSAESHKFYCSPQRRAHRTAEIALGQIGAHPTKDSRLSEISVGKFEGLTMEACRAGWPEVFATEDAFDWYFNTPEGEDLKSITDRATAFLSDVSAPSVVITHGITSRILRGVMMGLDMDGMASLEGGQGVVYHIKDKVQRKLEV